MMKNAPIILGIESSCDDTSAAVLKGKTVLSNEVCSQKVHVEFGGVMPEAASREHIRNIVPTVEVALKKANIEFKDLDAIAFTQGPGLIGSLLVGNNYVSGLATALEIPKIAVHHMHAHVLALTLHEDGPEFPFLCLTVSGGHTQLVLVHEPTNMEVVGQTIDDAAGEAFDKAAKMLGLPYPGGPLIDKYAKEGDPNAFQFAKPNLEGLKFSFSGLKTSVLYTLQKLKAENPNIVEERLADLCASIQQAILDALLIKVKKAMKLYPVKHIGIAGGVSANSGLREQIKQLGESKGWKVHIPDFQFCTDNAAMIGIAGYYKYLKGEFADEKSVANARLPF